ncbi:MAG TPA: hypothetical protein VKE74_22330, partial [Gemmataceae bacterium]|nr:hypothetical protein [Gemmataceae bacterium]
AETEGKEVNPGARSWDPETYYLHLLLQTRLPTLAKSLDPRDAMSQEICQELSDGLLGDTLDFLTKNAVLMNIDGEPLPTSPIRRFDFAKPFPTQSGGHIYFPTILDSSVVNGYLVASYLPWAENSGYYIILEPDQGPDLMFTATLDGCAVGYIRADDGAVRISHHNIQGPMGTDHKAQKRSLAFATGTVHKKDYYYKQEPQEKGEFYVKKECVGIICGVRKNNTWRMYAQILRRVGKTNLKTGDFILKSRIESVQEF